MAHDPLASLARIRRLACDDAERVLGRCIAAESRSGADAREAELEIGREAEVAASLEGDDALVEAFAAWLPVARARAEQARAAHERQQAETARARAVLAASRTALETIEVLVAGRAKVRANLVARREQADLDEACRPARGEAGDGVRLSGP